MHCKIKSPIVPWPIFLKKWQKMHTWPYFVFTFHYINNLCSMVPQVLMPYYGLDSKGTLCGQSLSEIIFYINLIWPFEPLFVLLLYPLLHYVFVKKKSRYFYLLVLFGSDFVSWVFIKNFQTFLEVKINIYWVNLTPCQAYCFL